MSRYELMVVPQGASSLEVLAEQYCRAFGKLKAGREQWIEGTLELAVIMAKAKFSGHREFSQWLYRHGFEHMHPNDRAALLGFSRDIQTARKLLEKSKSISWRVIWENRPKAAPTKIGKGRKQSKHNWSGSQKRKYVPDAMRDDPPAPVTPPKPTKQLSDYGLTPEQVDPDFKGTALEFATMYGHVNLHTKEQLEHHRQQEALAAFLASVSDLERTSRAMLAALSKVVPGALNEWKGRPGKAEKLRSWCNNVQLAYEAIAKLTA